MNFVTSTPFSRENILRFASNLGALTGGSSVDKPKRQEVVARL
jgi:hypothetical protein